MEKAIHFIKKYSFEITVMSILTAISAALYCIYPLSGVVFASLCLLIQACAYKDNQRKEQEQLQRLEYIYYRYQETAELVYSIFKTFDYVGFNPTDKYSICYPDDYFHINAQDIVVFRYRCVLKTPIETDTSTLRRMINEANESSPYYQGLYVLKITQENGFASIVVTYQDETTKQFIQDYERRILKKTQHTKVNTADQDF